MADPIDQRELVLDKVYSLLGQSIEGINSTARNRGLIKTDKRPCIVQLDGDETRKTAPARLGRAMMMAPRVMAIRPQIFVLLENKQPNNEGLGQELNLFRLRIMAKLTKDAGLIALLGSNGGVDYEGCETDLKSGQPLLGQMRLDFVFWYVFDPTKL